MRCALTDRCEVDDVPVPQVKSPVLIGGSEDLDQVSRLRLLISFTRGHLKHRHTDITDGPSQESAVKNLYQ